MHAHLMSSDQDAGRRALIVTDSPLNALPAAAALSDSGYSVECALPESLAEFVQSKYIDRFSLLVIKVGSLHAAGMAIVSMGRASRIQVLGLAADSAEATLLLAQAGIPVVQSEDRMADVAKASHAGLVRHRDPLILTDAWLG